MGERSPWAGGVHVAIEDGQAGAVGAGDEQPGGGARVGGADGAAREAQAVFREREHVVPPAGFQVRFQLVNVEVQPRALADAFLRVVERVQAKVEQAAGQRLAVQSGVFLVQVQAAWGQRPDQGPFVLWFSWAWEQRGLLAVVVIATLGYVVINLAVDLLYPVIDVRLRRTPATASATFLHAVEVHW